MSRTPMVRVPVLLLVLFSAGIASAAELGFAQLARRPELWPAECTISKALKFSGGKSVEAGQKLSVVDVRGNEVVVATLDGELVFGVAPTDTDFVQVAQTAFEALTPKQRELTLPVVLSRPDLWPYKVKLTQPVEFSDGTKLEPGSELVLLGAQGNQVEAHLAATNTILTLEPRQTDIVAQARVAVEAPEMRRPRLLQELAGKTISAKTGEKVDLSAAKGGITAVYFSAGWCGPCRKFSPNLVKFYEEKKKDHPEFEVYFVSFDKAEDDMKAYMREEKFPWRALGYEHRGTTPVITQYQASGIPQLLVLDAEGKKLIDSAQIGTDAALAQLGSLLEREKRAAEKAKAAEEAGKAEKPSE